MRFLALLCCLATFAVPASSAGEKTEGEPKTVPTAWGKPVNGLQAGVRVKLSDPSPGAVLDLQVAIRNIQIPPERE
jgi:hypothetical protein